MITAVSTTILEQIGNRARFSIVLSDGRTMTTTAKTEKEAIKTILKHVNAAPVAVVEITAGDLAQTIWGASKIWDNDMCEFAARIAAAAEGNETMTSIVANWRKYRTASMAQAGAIGRFAFANNITL